MSAATPCSFPETETEAHPEWHEIVGIPPLSLQVDFSESFGEKWGRRLRVFFGLEDLDGHPCESLHPESTFVTGWGGFQSIALLYISAFLPVRIAFENEMTCEPGLIYFDFFLDLYFLLDIVLNFFTGYALFAQYELQRRHVVFHYLKSYFFFDVIISIPVTWLTQYGRVCAGSQSDSSSALMFARLLRMLRLARVVRVFKMFSLPIFARLRVNHFVFQLFKMLLVLLFVMHLAACTWHLIKTFDDDEHLEAFEIKNRMHGKNVWSKYIAALYFACATLTTVGYGDIAASTSAERIYAIIAMMLGAGIFAAVISNISSLLASQSSKEKLYENKLRELNDFITFHDVPPALAKRMRDFHFYNCRASDNRKINTIPMELPPILRTLMCDHLAQDILRPVSLFRGAPKDYITTIFLALRPYRCAPGDVLMVAGYRGSELFLVHKGQVKRFDADGSTLLGPGDVFGEELCATSSTGIYEFTVTATQLSELYVLNVKDVKAANAVYPEMGEQFKLLALCRTPTPKPRNAQRRPPPLQRLTRLRNTIVRKLSVSSLGQDGSEGNDGEMQEGAAGVGFSRTDSAVSESGTSFSRETSPVTRRRSMEWGVQKKQASAKSLALGLAPLDDSLIGTGNNITEVQKTQFRALQNNLWKAKVDSLCHHHGNASPQAFSRLSSFNDIPSPGAVLSSVPVQSAFDAVAPPVLAPGKDTSRARATGRGFSSPTDLWPGAGGTHPPVPAPPPPKNARAADRDPVWPSTVDAGSVKELSQELLAGLADMKIFALVQFAQSAAVLQGERVAPGLDVACAKLVHAAHLLSRQADLHRDLKDEPVSVAYA